MFFYLCLYQNQNFSLVPQSCRLCSTPVALVLLVSHSCCTRVASIALVLHWRCSCRTCVAFVSGTRVEYETRSKKSLRILNIVKIYKFEGACGELAAKTFFKRQSWTKSLRQTLYFMSNSALRESPNFCISVTFWGY